MKFWRLAIALSIASCAAIHSANAGIINIDWKTTGDRLITRDTVSGLDWLDLSLTVNTSYTNTLSQLQSGEQLEGWRYASNAEVITLWANFGVDLSSTAPGLAYGFDQNVNNASYVLGSVLCEYNCNIFPFGSLGITGDAFDSTQNSRSWMGAYAFQPAYKTAYLADGAYFISDYDAAAHTGSYLVQASVVPLPATVLLFSTGLLGLAGVARRRVINLEKSGGREKDV